MMVNSFLGQIITAGIALAIIFTYIKPTIERINLNQNDLTDYQEERDKVNDTIARLNNRLSDVNNLSEDDRKKLSTFLPEKIDEVQVMRDLDAIARAADLSLTTITYQPSSASSQAASGTQDTVALSEHVFTMNLTSSYDRLKRLVDILQYNHCPIYPKELEVTTNEGGFLNVNLQVSVFSL